MIRRQFGLWVLKTLSACQLLNLPLFGCLPPPTMANLILMSLRSLLTGFRNRAAMHAEIIALRQLIVLQRTQKTKRLILGPSDRCLWVWLSRLWLRWRSALIIVKPETDHRLASSGIPVVLDLEDSLRPVRTSSCFEMSRLIRLHSEPRSHRISWRSIFGATRQ